MGLFLVPSEALDVGKKHVVDDDDDDDEAAAAANDADQQQQNNVTTQAELQGEEEVEVVCTSRVFDAPIGTQLKSLEFWLLAFLMSVFMLRLNFFIATVTDQRMGLAPFSAALSMGHFFSVMLPIGGVVAIPALGYLLDHFGLLTFMLTVIGLGSSFGILSLIPNAHVQYLSMIVFVLLRPALYTAGNFYVGQVFGYAHFGTCYGVLFLITAIGNSTQYFLEYVVNKWLAGNYFQIHLILTLLTLVTLVCPYQLHVSQSHHPVVAQQPKKLQKTYMSVNDMADAL
jgi:hypothetical protein